MSRYFVTDGREKTSLVCHLAHYVLLDSRMHRIDRIRRRQITSRPRLNYFLDVTRRYFQIDLIYRTAVRSDRTLYHCPTSISFNLDFTCHLSVPPLRWPILLLFPFSFPFCPLCTFFSRIYTSLSPLSPVIMSRVIIHSVDVWRAKKSYQDHFRVPVDGTRRKLSSSRPVELRTDRLSGYPRHHTAATNYECFVHPFHSLHISACSKKQAETRDQIAIHIHLGRTIAGPGASSIRSAPRASEEKGKPVRPSLSFSLASSALETVSWRTRSRERSPSGCCG